MCPTDWRRSMQPWASLQTRSLRCEAPCCHRGGPMFEADEFLRAAESRIAASAPLPEEARVAGIASRALRLRRRDSFVRWGGLAAGILVVAGAGAFAFLPD